MKLSLCRVVFLAALWAAQSVLACPEPTVTWSPNPVCVGCKSVLTLGHTEIPPGYAVVGDPWADYVGIFPTANSPTAAASYIDEDETGWKIIWSEPGYCSVVVTAKLDWVCTATTPHTYGTSTNRDQKDFTVGRMETFKLTDATNANNNKQDTTDSDATPTDNTLYLAEDTNRQARVAIALTMTPTNGNVGNIFKWEISGSGWSPASGDFSAGTITSVWTNAGGTVDREFTVVVQCGCGAGGDCANCAYRRMLKIAVLKVESETVATVPADRTRKKVGVGEQVTLTLQPTSLSPVSWSISGNGMLSATTGNPITFTAHDSASTPSVTATYAGTPCTVAFTVVEPTSESAVKTSEDTFSAGTQGAGMWLRITIAPTDVSFQWVESREVPGPATSITGYFTNYPASSLAHVPAGWVSIAPGNTKTDHAAFSGFPPPWYAGGFEWIIPIEWRVIGKTNVGTLPNRTQTFSIAGTNGTSTVTKLGQSVTRTP